MAMYSPRKSLCAPSDYGFPYVPYEIQQNLMQELFTVIERKQIGIFESPTGTGKSLTLTCGALTWLEQHEQLVRTDLEQRIRSVESEIQKLQTENAKADDWIAAQGATHAQRNELQQLLHLHTLLQQKEQLLVDMKKRKKEQRPMRKPIHNSHQSSANDSPRISDGEDDDEEAASAEGNEELEEEDKSQRDDRYRDVQIFYCSRTHSQLAQIVAELRKTRHSKWLRCVTLGSRQQLCVNAAVRNLPNVALMNERCLDMAKSKSKVNANPSKKLRSSEGTAAPPTTGCRYKTQPAMQTLSDISLCDLLDIEEIAARGTDCGGCPYYALRAAQAHAQLVLLPYPLLLQRSARLQNGIELNGSIVIVDEAHNLLDSIAQLHSCEVTRQQLEAVKDQLTRYKQFYCRRLNTRNMLYINQMVYVIKRLLLLIEGERKEAKEPRMLCTYELSSEGDFYNIDLHELLLFCERTRLAQKLHGFAQREPQRNENQPPARLKLLQQLQVKQLETNQSKRKLREAVAKEEEKRQLLPTPSMPIPSPLRPLLAFLATLTSDAADGRVLLNASIGSFKYLLLNPAEHFADIVKEARAVIIAGGTMQPTHELTAQLFGDCRERVVEHFYGHVVPTDAVQPFVVVNGPTGAPLRFSFAHRNNASILSELSMVLQNLCNVLPAGLVCFLPSYEYLEAVHKHLQSCGALDRIGQRKRVFREKASGNVEQLLQQYAAAIAEPNGGALLLSVVGGKLSEGLNFCDDLGRGVIVVGLPYPNRFAPEMKERLHHLDKTLGDGSGNEYYENLCMKAVNQCIGRSVRHIGDYACVYLLDERYANDRIVKKLPAWISRNIVISTASGGFGAVQARTAQFFKAKKSTQVLKSK